MNSKQISLKESLNKTNKRKLNLNSLLKFLNFKPFIRKQKYQYNSQSDKSLIDPTDTRKNGDFLNE